jgi:hypothetical protein
MSRVAIIGSCITRDLWPIRGDEAEGLLYVSRTSLPSLFAPGVPAFRPSETPPSDLTRSQHRAVVSDIRKEGLTALLAHKPTHIILDFIDERFDLLAVGRGLMTHSWELEVSGYLADPLLAGARPIPRLSAACEDLWMDAAIAFAAFMAQTPLRDARLILHDAQWAETFRDRSGQTRPFEAMAIWEHRPARAYEHNGLLRRYQDALSGLLPEMAHVSADRWRVADEAHRWGLSPFHYAPEYYEEIWRQLRDLGV